MSTTQDGNFTVPLQHGAKQPTLPLQADGDEYTVEIFRQYKALAKYYDPLRRVRNSWVQALIYSDDLTNAAWTKTNATASAASVADPEGDQNAVKVEETGATGAHSVAQAMTIAAGAVGFGAFLKQSERSVARLRVNNATDGNVALGEFDLSAGTASPATAAISRLFDGWFWCRVAGTATTHNSSAIIDIGNGSSFSYAGATGSGVYAFRQTAVQSASTPFPAILTTSATRAVTAPVVDVDDPLAFLVEELSPGTSGLEFGIAEWQRAYARVSVGTEPPSSVIVAKPEPPISGTRGESGGVYFEQPDATEDKWDIYKSVEVTSDSGVASYYPTAGTYYLGFVSSTSGAIAYSGTAGAVQTALNAVAPVASRGNVTVTGSYQVGMTVAFATITALTVDMTNLTVTSGFTKASSVNSFAQGSSQAVALSSFITGGTYTITLCGQTTGNIAYNATVSDIQTALNALSEVTARGGVTVRSSDNVTVYNAALGTMVFSVYFEYPDIIGDAGLLTPAPALIQNISTNQGFTQTLYFSSGNAQRTIFAPSHGIASAGTIYLRYGAGSTIGYYSGITAYTVIDDSHVSVFPSTINPWGTATPLTRIGPLKLSGYQSGPVNIRCKRVSRYYLPGFTPGVATVDDIPVPTPQSDPVAFFNAVIDTTVSTVNWDVGQQEVWRGPIIRQTTVQIRRNDLVP